MFHICKTYADLISDIDCFILSSQFAALCRKHEELSIRVFHQNLNVEDCVAVLIWKQKLLTYSEESSLADKHESDIFCAYTKHMFDRYSTEIHI